MKLALLEESTNGVTLHIEKKYGDKLKKLYPKLWSMTEFKAARSLKNMLTEDGKNMQDFNSFKVYANAHVMFQEMQAEVANLKTQLAEGLRAGRAMHRPIGHSIASAIP